MHHLDALGRELVRSYAARGRFSHREHLHLAWSYLQRDDPTTAATNVVKVIRHVAAEHGTPEKYHETLTQFWIGAVDHAMAEHRQADFDELLRRHPQLLDSGLHHRHWTPSLLSSPQARREWVNPDLESLPWSEALTTPPT